MLRLALKHKVCNMVRAPNEKISRRNGVPKLFGADPESGSATQPPLAMCSPSCKLNTQRNRVFSGDADSLNDIVQL